MKKWRVEGGNIARNTHLVIRKSLARQRDAKQEITGINIKENQDHSRRRAEESLSLQRAQSFLSKFKGPSRARGVRNGNKREGENWQPRDNRSKSGW